MILIPSSGAHASRVDANGLPLTLFASAVRRVFGLSVAIGALLFLAIDPTVAAHLPVVMTDLPVSLLSATSVVLAARAFYAKAWSDVIGCFIMLGLALVTEHSAPVFVLFIVLAQTGLALTPAASGTHHTGLNRLGSLVTLIAIALIVELLRLQICGKQSSSRGLQSSSVG
jgi:4-amino-4-deoxy-L-arabinose transferase-like glycosyltransferase